MKRFKRLFSSTSAAVLTLSSLLSLGFTGVAHAAATYTCAWTGGGDGTTFSDAANWSGCNSAAPVPADIDSLVFDLSSLTAAKTVNNDIVGLVVTDLSFTGTNPGTTYPVFTLSGNAITVNGTLVDSVSGGAQEKVAADITLGSDMTLSSGINFDTSGNQMINLNGHSLTLSAGQFLNIVSGNGNITVTPGQYLVLSKANPNWAGNLTVGGGSASAQIYPGATTAANNITVQSGGSIATCGFNGASEASPLTVGGAAIYVAASCGMGSVGGGFNAAASVNWTGAITLTADTTANGDGEFKVSGPLSGNYSISEASGSAGKVTIASSNNTSKTSSGTQVSATLTTEYKDNQPTTSLFIGNNNIGVVDGIYGQADVLSGGTLMGSGTVGSLTIESGGIVAPGHSPGCLNTGNLLEGGTYQVQIGGTTACTGYDQLNVTGTVDLTNGTLSVTRYNNFTGFKAGQVYTIINNDGTDAVTGTFTGLAEGATFKLDNGTVMKVSYVGGTGNDVTLTVVSVPTVPDTGFTFASANPVMSLALMAGAAGALMVVARRIRPAHAVARKSTRRK